MAIVYKAMIKARGNPDSIGSLVPVGSLEARARDRNFQQVNVRNVSQDALLVTRISRVTPTKLDREIGPFEGAQHASDSSSLSSNTRMSFYHPGQRFHLHA